MKTKYNIGQEVLVRCVITKIEVEHEVNGVQTYYISFEDHDHPYTFFREEDIVDDDFVPVETYEEDVNRLKDEINRLKMIIAKQP